MGGGLRLGNFNLGGVFAHVGHFVPDDASSIGDVVALGTGHGLENGLGILPVQVEFLVVAEVGVDGRFLLIPLFFLCLRLDLLLAHLSPSRVEMLLYLLDSLNEK